MTVQFALSTLLPLITFVFLAGAALRLAARQLLPGKTRIAFPLFAFAAICELAVLVVGWVFLFDAEGRFREPAGWVIHVFTIVEPLARLSALSAAVLLFVGLKGASAAGSR
jgi:hypothetical protein